MLTSFVLTDCSDRDLITRLKRLVARGNETTAHIVAHLAEIDLRRLYVEEGCASLFKYCVEVLHLSEAAAYRRIDVARLARRFPIIFEKLADGSVSLSTAQLLGPCLSEENHMGLLKAATHKSKEEVEHLLAAMRPSLDVPSVLRKLPGRPAEVLGRGEISEASLFLEGAGFLEEPCKVTSAMQSLEEASYALPPAETPVGRPPVSQKPVVAPLAPDRYKIQFTADGETYRMLRQLQELLRHQIPDGDPAEIFSTALRLLHEQVTREKIARVKRPREKTGGTPGASNGNGSGVPGEAGREQQEAQAKKRGSAKSRHIPAHVKREVWFRDDGQCAFVSPSGRRCSERGRLEFHHVEPYAWGGRATVDNIALRCRTHNAHEGEVIFGSVRHRARAKGEREETLSGESHAVPTLAAEVNSVRTE